MASADIPVPDTLKPIRPYMLLAKQHDNRDKIISYFCKQQHVCICQSNLNLA